LKDMQSTIAGANFQLEYPTELLRLKDRSSHSAGGMVAKNAAAIWNVSPAQTDYSKQDGTLAMAVSSPEPWTVKNGVLAELSFEVQDGADLNRAVLALSEVEVTPDGFDNRMLPDVVPSATALCDGVSCLSAGHSYNALIGAVPLETIAMKGVSFASTIVIASSKSRWLPLPKSVLLACTPEINKPAILVTSL